MRAAFGLCVLLAATSVQLGCKPRAAPEASGTASLFGSGGDVLGSIDKLVPPELENFDRYRRNKGRPWVAWQWFPGSQDDREESEASQALGIVGTLAALDFTRARMVATNLVDTNGLYGNGGSAGHGDGKSIWVALQSGDVCETPSDCHHESDCGPKRMDNPRWRARTLSGICNDFDNLMMGAVGQRLARNTAIPAVNTALARFGGGESLASKTPAGDSDPKLISATLMQRTDPANFNPAPHFNMWAAAWIQFMTHDWFAHSNDGFNDRQNSYKMSDGTSVSRTLTDNGAGIRGNGPRPARTFRNNVTHWWDGSQLYGWNKESQARVRDGANLKVGPDGLLPEMDVAKFANKQEASAFVENWWVGLSLLHDLFARHHNYLVKELRAHERPPSGAAAWTDDELFDTARLIVSALIAKIHTIEWTPQLLFNKGGNFAMQGNWNGVLNFDFDNTTEGFKQKVTESYQSRFQDKVITFFGNQFRCGIVPSTLGSLVGITHIKAQQHFCSPFTLPEEFTAVYRLHAMLPDNLDIWSGEQQKFVERVPTASLLGDKTHGAIKRLGIDNLVVTFGVHPCGQLTANNFPTFLTQLSVPGQADKLDMAAMDVMRDRERGVPRFNDFRQNVGLKRLTSFDDFVDTELQWEIDNARPRDGMDVKLTEDEVNARRQALAAQQAHVERLKGIYATIDDVDLQVGILSEFTRPHGFVISETQFQIFILNASRRLFSDRFLTEAYTAEFYTPWGLAQVGQTTLMDLIRRHFPEAAKDPAAQHAFNAFDLWDRKRDGLSLCPEGSSWFASQPATFTAYKNLLCHTQRAAIRQASNH